MTFSSKKTTAVALAMSILSFSLPPIAMAQGGGPQLNLQPTGNVQVWNPSSSSWDKFGGGPASQGQTFRCIEGGSLVGTVQNEGSSTETITLSSCSAIRFIRLRLGAHGNTIYAKAFGQIATVISQDRQGIDDIKLEFPVGLEILGRDSGTAQASGLGAFDNSLGKTTFQTPTAREVRLGLDNGSHAKLQGLSFVTGSVQSIDPPSSSFKLKEDVSGRVDTVSLKYWSQLAKPTLAQRVVNETPAAMLGQLAVGQPLTVYGVATGRGSASVPFAQGSAAFAQATAVNFLATVIFPNGGQFIFGGTFVLSSPITPAVGQGLSGAGLATLQLAVGQLQAALLPGLQLVSVACEIGDELFIIPAGGTASNLPLFIGLGAAAAILLIGHGSSSNNPPPTIFFPNASQ